MDPNVTLQELRDALREMDAAFGDEDVVVSVVEKIEALDEWLSKGGFAPQAWTPPPYTVRSTFYNVSASVTYNTGTGWSASRTGPTVVIDSAIQGALSPDAAIDVFIELIKSTHAIDDSDLELSVVATDRESDAFATRTLRLTF